MKPSEEEEFKEKSNEEKMEKEMKNNDEEIDWNDLNLSMIFWLTLLSFHDAMFQYYFTMFLRIITTHWFYYYAITKKSAVCFLHFSNRFDFWDSIQGHLLPHSVTQSPNATLLNPGQTSIQVSKSPPGHPAVGSSGKSRANRCVFTEKKL